LALFNESFIFPNDGSSVLMDNDGPAIRLAAGGRFEMSVILRSEFARRQSDTSRHPADLAHAGRPDICPTGRIEGLLDEAAIDALFSIAVVTTRDSLLMVGG
jgi:hypothetical protein